MIGVRSPKFKGDRRAAPRPRSILGRLAGVAVAPLREAVAFFLPGPELRATGAANNPLFAYPGAPRGRRRAPAVFLALHMAAVAVSTYALATTLPATILATRFADDIVPILGPEGLREIAFRRLPASREATVFALIAANDALFLAAYLAVRLQTTGFDRSGPFKRLRPKLAHDWILARLGTRELHRQPWLASGRGEALAGAFALGLLAHRAFPWRPPLLPFGEVARSYWIGVVALLLAFSWLAARVQFLIEWRLFAVGRFAPIRSPASVALSLVLAAAALLATVECVRSTPYWAVARISTPKPTYKFYNPMMSIYRARPAFTEADAAVDLARTGATAFLAASLVLAAAGRISSPDAPRVLRGRSERRR